MRVSFEYDKVSVSTAVGRVRRGRSLVESCGFVSDGTSETQFFLNVGFHPTQKETRERRFPDVLCVNPFRLREIRGSPERFQDDRDPPETEGGVL